MATRRWGISLGENFNQVTEGVGAAVALDSIELTVDLAPATLAKAEGRLKVVEALECIMAQIMKGNWPPA